MNVRIRLRKQEHCLKIARLSGIPEYVLHGHLTDEDEHPSCALYDTSGIFDHLQIGVVYNFGRVCMSLCLSDGNF